MKITILARPELTPFNPFHPHQFHQKVLVSFRDGESVEDKTLFVSCPETGLTPELVNAFLVADMGADEDFDSTGLSDGWYWREYQDGSLKADIVSDEVYANIDSVLLEYRRYNLDMFYPSFYVTDGKTVQVQNLAMEIIKNLDPVVGKMFAITPELLDSESNFEPHMKANDLYKCARANAFEYIFYRDMVDATDEQEEISDAADLLVIEYFKTQLEFKD